MSDKINFSLSGMSGYTLPEVKEVRSQKWVQYGEDNLYYQFLIDLYNSSSTHSAIINGISSLIAGKGFMQDIKVIKPETLERVAFDLKTLGSFCLNVIWDKTGEKIALIKHIPMEKVRVGKMDERGKISQYFLSNDWTAPTGRNKPIPYPAFSKPKKNENGKVLEASQIAYFKPYKSGFDYYSPVDYQGSLSWIELDGEIANFHVNNIKNGLTPSMIFKFKNSQPDDEAMRIMENKIKRKFSGSSNSGKFFLSFSEGVDDVMEVDVLPVNDADKQYEFLSSEVSRKVLTGHRVTSPLLFGIRGDGSGFGNNAEELRDAFILFEEIVIDPFQRFITNAFEEILQFNGINNIQIEKQRPRAFFDEGTGRVDSQPDQG